jgi:hypothetical protein
MKLIRSGGVNSTLNKNNPNYSKHGFGNYFMLQIKPELDELIRQVKTITICVAAKPDKHHYDQRLTGLGFTIEDLTILGREDKAEWGLYDAVLLLGGETRELYSWLQKNHFSLEVLSRCVVLAGDSAGAYVLSGKTLIDYTPDGQLTEIVDGFLPDIHQLVTAHVNNPYYHKFRLTKVLDTWCKTNKIEYVELQENELDIREIYVQTNS